VREAALGIQAPARFATGAAAPTDRCRRKEIAASDNLVIELMQLLNTLRGIEYVGGGSRHIASLALEVRGGRDCRCLAGLSAQRNPFSLERAVATDRPGVVAQDPEVDEVLKAFYEDGSCTPGWVIFV
jgi:hypothetical protein